MKYQKFLQILFFCNAFLQDVESETGETFIERYSKGVSAVDTILFLDRSRTKIEYLIILLLKFAALYFLEGGGKEGQSIYAKKSRKTNLIVQCMIK